MEFKKLFLSVNIYIVFNTPAHLSAVGKQANFLFSFRIKISVSKDPHQLFRNLSKLGSGSSFSPECRFLRSTFQLTSLADPIRHFK
jgi:hypothetical protein